MLIKPEEKTLSEAKGLGQRITLKVITKNHVVKVWNGFIWFRM
jgi:hypothetical protein